MEQQKYKEWAKMTIAEKESWWNSITGIHSQNEQKIKNVSESEKMIDEAFKNCGSEWDSLKSFMKQDDRFKLQRIVREVDNHGHISECREFY